METVPRHKTAIVRHAYSKPIALAIADLVLTPARSVFDYGCGHGVDVRLLREAGYEVAGWDPTFSPDGPKRAADVVNLGYVLNVIEDVGEREEALRMAYSLARRCLVVSVLMASGTSGNLGDVFGDGILTRRGTFQKYFSQEELRQFIESTLAVQADAASPGVFYVFRSEVDRQAFLLSKVVRKVRREARRTAPLAETLAPYRGLLEAFATRIEELGRTPRESEFGGLTELRARIGTPTRCVRICEELFEGFSFDESRRARNDDLLVYIAPSRFGRRPRFGDLPEVLQWDIRDLFGSYSRACDMGDELLFGVGEPGAIDRACSQSRVGKILPDDLYVHVSALEKLSPILRVYTGCGRAILGEVEGANVLKIHRHSGKLSYLSYPTFDRSPHPALTRSVSINLRTREVWSRDYSHSDNPPILHRKETFVHESHPLRKKFEELTRREEEAGLLGSGVRIGFAREWAALLQDKGYFLRGHRLCRQRKFTGVNGPGSRA